MAINDAISAIADVLSALDGIDQVLTEPPATLPADVTFCLYARPGNSTVAAMRGRSGGIVYNSDYQISALYNKKLAKGDPPTVIGAVEDAYDAARDALWNAYARGGFSGTVLRMDSLNTDMFEPAEYGSQLCFSFRMLLNVTIQIEAGAR